MLAAEVIGAFYGTTKREACEYVSTLFSPAMLACYLALEWRDANKVSQLAASINNNINNFHQDCGGIVDHIIVWSNREQTEIRELETKVILPPFPPYRVIRIYNQVAEHRVPPRLSKDRCFFRLTPMG